MHWILKERDWSTPIEILKEENAILFVKICDVPLTKMHRLVTTQALDASCYGKEGDVWVFPRETLGAIANPAEQNADPELAVRWNPLGFKFDEPEYPSKNPDLFFAEMAEAGLAKTPETARFLWGRICYFTLRWLMQGNQLDMNWAIIDSLPYRLNFLEAMRQIYHTQFSQKIARRTTPTYITFLRRMRWFIFHENLFAYVPRTGYVDWNLFIVPRALWGKMLMRRELMRRRQPFYFSQIIDTLKGRHEKIVKLFYRYFKATRFPKLKVCYCPVEKRVQGVSHPEYTLSVDSDDLSVLPPSLYTLITKYPDCIEADKVQEAEGVPPLPDIQPEGDNVRKPWHRGKSWDKPVEVDFPV